MNSDVFLWCHKGSCHRHQQCMYSPCLSRRIVPKDGPEIDMVDTQAAREADALRHKLIADIFDLPVWERGKDRVVTPPWHALTVAERDLLADALRQWKPA